MDDQGKSVGFLARGGLWVVAQIVLFGLILLVPLVWRPTILFPGLWTRIVGGILIVLGLVLLVSGLIGLGSSLTPLPYPRDNSELRTDGVFRLVRHPVYGGLILTVAGLAFCLPSIPEACLALGTLFFFDRKASREERWLRDRYPAYAEYSRRSRKLFPWVY